MKRGITLDGLTRSITEWCAHYGVKVRTYEERRRRGWTVRQALETPTGAFPCASPAPSRASLLRENAHLHERVATLQRLLASAEQEIAGYRAGKGRAA